MIQAMSRVGNAALFTVFLSLTGMTPAHGATPEPAAPAQDSTALAPEGVASPLKALGDSSRVGPLPESRARGLLAGSVLSIVDDGALVSFRRRKHPPYSKGLHWPDRPLSGIGTHIPGRGQVELESEAISYARSTRTEPSWFSRWTTDTTGYGFPHYVNTHGPERFRREIVRAAVQHISLGISSRVAAVFASDGYTNNRLTAEQVTNNSQAVAWHKLSAIKLKLRPWGSDSIGWSHAIALELAGRDEYVIVGYSFSQDIPLGHRTKGSLSAAVEGAHYPGGRSYGNSNLYGGRRSEPTFDFEPFDAALAIEHRWTPALWSFTEWSIHRDLVLPEVSTGLISLGAATSLGTHFMLDAGARFGTTRQSPDVQGFVGFSLR